MFKIAKYYDIIYSWKEYEREIEYIYSLLERNLKPIRDMKILNIGCGTGEHLKYLCLLNSVDSFDINPHMVKIAKKKVPNANIYVDDMVSFQVESKYDLIICLFSTISYSRNSDNFDKVLLNVYNSLKNGGVFIFEPHFTNRKFYDSICYKKIIQHESLFITRNCTSKLLNDKAEVIFKYEINDNNKIKRFDEIHEMIFLDKGAIYKKLNSIFTIVNIYSGFKLGKENFLTIK